MSLFWLLPAVALAHVFEEFVFPGGFADWDREYRRALAASITTSFHIVINLAFVAFCFLPLVLNSEYGVAWWLCMGSVLLVNSAFHIRGAFKTRRDSPGVFTSVALHIPVATYGYWFFHSTQKTTVEQALVFSATSVSYLLFSTPYHKRRTRKAEALKDKTH